MSQIDTKPTSTLFQKTLSVLGGLLVLTSYLLFSEDTFANTNSEEKTAGSFLVLLRQTDDTSSSLDSISIGEKRERVSQKEKAFAKTDKNIRASLSEVPGLKDVRPYPALLSYIVHVEDVEKAKASLEKIAKQNSSIYRVGRFFPADAELDVSPNAIMLRTDEEPRGDNWWLGTTPLKSTTIAILDDGVNINHPMINHPSRQFFCQPSANPNDPKLAVCAEDLTSAHGTSMTGIYVSRFANYAGIASMPGTDTVTKPGPINHFLIAKAGEETEDGRVASAEGLLWLLAQQENPHVFPDVINYSQGNGMICPDENTDCDPTAYSTFAELIDGAIDTVGVSFIKSAGNKGYNASKATVTVPGDAYNVIAVGNLNPFDFDRCTIRGGNREHFKIYTSSSVSPTYAELDNNQARRLLHVAAPGRSINTSGLNPAYCIARCEGDATCESSCASLGKEVPGYDPELYGYWRASTGTSPAAPMVGSLASFLHASGVEHPAAIKAVIINSADSWTSSNTPNPATPDANPPVPENCVDPIVAQHHPIDGSHYDRSYGWGVLNASDAYHQRKNVIMGYISSGKEKRYFGTLDDFEKATLVWQKHYGKPLAQLNLTLSYKKDGVWIPLMTDPSTLDNVKQVSNGTAAIAPVDATDFMLTVSAKKGAEFDNEGFALVTAQRFK